MRKTIALLTILMVCVVVLAGCAKTQKTTTGQPVQNVKYTPTELEKLELQKKIDSKYSNPQAHYELAQLYRRDAQWEKAEAEYNIALQLSPGFKKAQAASVKMNLEKGDDTKSALLGDIFINQASGSAEALLVLGQAFQAEQLEDYAFTCFDKALMLAPNSSALHRQMGYYYKKSGDAVRAEEAFKRSFQLDPYNAEVAGELGRMGVIVEVPRKQDTTTNKLSNIEQKPAAPQQ